MSIKPAYRLMRKSIDVPLEGDISTFSPSALQQMHPLRHESKARPDIRLSEHTTLPSLTNTFTCSAADAYTSKSISRSSP